MLATSQLAQAQSAQAQVPLKPQPVANGIVRNARGGEPNRSPLALLPTLTHLAKRLLLGNLVAPKAAPGVFAHSTHLQPSSLAVKAGDRGRWGLGRLGRWGQAPLPHLHF